MHSHSECRAQRGFTLIEIVVALTISAVLVGFVAYFVSAPIDAYVDHAARSRMAESTENVSRMMVDDLRHALPNSVRVSNVGNYAVVEMLRVKGMAYFRPNGVLPDTTTVPILTSAARGLDFALADDRFSVFGLLDPNVVPPAYPTQGTLLGGYLVIGNTGVGAQGSAYQIGGAGPRVITPVGTQIRLNRHATTFEETITLDPKFLFANPMPVTLTRVFWVEGPVTYVCNANANSRSLRRFSGYPITATGPANESAAQLGVATTSLLADNVASCRLDCGPNSNVCQGGIVIDIGIQRAVAGGNETLRVFEQVALDNEK
jgi:MSHA biogenesis protein MshO